MTNVLNLFDQQIQIGDSVFVWVDADIRVGDQVQAYSSESMRNYYGKCTGISESDVYMQLYKDGKPREFPRTDVSKFRKQREKDTNVYEQKLLFPFVAKGKVTGIAAEGTHLYTVTVPGTSLPLPRSGLGTKTHTEFVVPRTQLRIADNVIQMVMETQCFEILRRHAYAGTAREKVDKYWTHLFTMDQDYTTYMKQNLIAQTYLGYLNLFNYAYYVQTWTKRHPDNIVDQRFTIMNNALRTHMRRPQIFNQDNYKTWKTNSKSLETLTLLQKLEGIVVIPFLWSEGMPIDDLTLFIQKSLGYSKRGYDPHSGWNRLEVQEAISNYNLASNPPPPDALRVTSKRTVTPGWRQAQARVKHHMGW